MTLGERIKEERNKLNLSQEKIAEMVGTSRQAVTKWEAGQSKPCMENLIMLAEIFGVSLEELTRGADGNAKEEGNEAKPHKPPLLLDIIFALIVVLATWSILKIP
jgi:transcriptional regulator with XRE-family HTH domain